MDPISLIAGLAGNIISKIWPDKTEQEKEAFTLELTREMNASQLLTKQIDVNNTEAASTNLFVAGWRPAVGWVCVSALAWQFVIMPILLFSAVLVGHPIPTPVFDTTTLIGILTSMLGMATLRSYDKKNQNN